MHGHHHITTSSAFAQHLAILLVVWPTDRPLQPPWFLFNVDVIWRKGENTPIAFIMLGVFHEKRSVALWRR